MDNSQRGAFPYTELVPDQYVNKLVVPRRKPFPKFPVDHAQRGALPYMELVPDQYVRTAFASKVGSTSSSKMEWVRLLRDVTRNILSEIGEKMQGSVHRVTRVHGRFVYHDRDAALSTRASMARR